MRKLLLALAFLLAPSFAWAQCNGVFPAATVCGTVNGGVPGPVAAGAGTLPAIAADNVLLNATGGSAIPTGQPVGSCSATADALLYNTSTHAFGCKTDVASLTVGDQTLSGGANVTSNNLGTVTTGTTTIDCGARPLQFFTNGGASTLAAPVNDGSCLVEVTNNGSAGAITFSGFTVGSNTGGALDTTNAHVFTISIWRINGTSGYAIFPHQGGSAVGTVTSITCNGGLTGGVITTVGTCAVDIATNSNVWAGTASKILDAHVAQTYVAPTALAISTATFTADLSLGINFSVTLVHASCPCTMASPTNVYAGASGFIEIIQSSTGSDTITTWGGNWKFPGGVKPTLSTGVSAKDVVPYFCDATNFCMVGAIQLAFQ